VEVAISFPICSSTPPVAAASEPGRRALPSMRESRILSGRQSALLSFASLRLPFRPSRSCWPCCLADKAVCGVSNGVPLTFSAGR
jgi:hypothetical protein